MEPFTLEWWEDLRFQASRKEDRARSWAADTKAARYNRLKVWIKDRINNKDTGK